MITEFIGKPRSGKAYFNNKSIIKLLSDYPIPSMEQNIKSLEDLENEKIFKKKF